MFPRINDGGLITGYYQKQYWRNVILEDLVSSLKAGMETRKVICLCSVSLGESTLRIASSNQAFFILSFSMLISVRAQWDVYSGGNAVGRV